MRVSRELCERWGQLVSAGKTMDPGSGYLGESRRLCSASKEEWGRRSDRVHCSVTSLETLAVSKVCSVLCSTSLFF